MPDRFTDERGWVLMKWVLNRPPKPVQIHGTNRVYIFRHNFHVCAAWVNPEDVERLLKVQEKTCNCNNGTYRNAFLLASELDRNLWVYGSRHKPEGVE